MSQQCIADYSEISEHFKYQQVGAVTKGRYA